MACSRPMVHLLPTALLLCSHSLVTEEECQFQPPEACLFFQPAVLASLMGPWRAGGGASALGRGGGALPTLLAALLPPSPPPPPEAEGGPGEDRVRAGVPGVLLQAAGRGGGGGHSPDSRQGPPRVAMALSLLRAPRRYGALLSSAAQESRWMWHRSSMLPPLVEGHISRSCEVSTCAVLQGPRCVSPASAKWQLVQDWHGSEAEGGPVTAPAGQSPSPHILTFGIKGPAPGYL